MSFGDTNLNYEVIKDDPVLAFDIDTQNIIYTLEKHTDTSKLADITMSPIHIYKEEAGEDTSLITGFTGFAVADISSYATSYVFYIVLGVIFLLLILYFLYMKRRNNTDAGRARALLKEHIKEAKRHKKEGKHEELQKTYKEIQETYKELSSKHKKKHYATIKKLHEKPT